MTLIFNRGFKDGFVSTEDIDLPSKHLFTKWTAKKGAHCAFCGVSVRDPQAYEPCTRTPEHVRSS